MYNIIQLNDKDLSELQIIAKELGIKKTDSYKKEKRAALKSALTSRVVENKFVVVDELKLDEIKTKKFVEVLKNLNVEKALVVLNDMDEKVIASAANIPTVKTTQTNELNVFDVLKYDTVVVTKAAVAIIEEVYA